MKPRHFRSQRGMATLVALVMMGMLVLIGLAAMSTSDDEVAITGNDLQSAKAFYAAESGLELAAADMMEEFATTGEPPASMPTGTLSVNDCDVTYSASKTASGAKKVLSTGNLAGLYGQIDSYAATAVGAENQGRASVQIQQTFEAATVPIFQFAVFYDDDLEFAPGPDMTLIGRMHTNGDMYVQSNTTLKIDSYVSAAGGVYHGRKGPGAVGAGDVQIKNAKGKYISMKQGTGWLDANDSWWKDSSTARWNGRVQDQAHGQDEYDMNLAGSDDARKLIEPASGNSDSYENKASLKFIDNQAYQYTAGSWVNVTATMTALGVMTYTADKFYDQREGEPVDVLDLDVSALYANGYAPSNGVIYFDADNSNPSDFPALRLKNGSTVGAPLTIASNNPVYTLGNFNSITKQPVSILSDAFTVLSGAWDDAKGALAKTDRTAASTTVNCSYLTGASQTTSTVYSGGFENLMRLLEDWNSKTLTWKGSAGKLWDSEQATGNFSTLYFNEPKRSWSYDAMLDDPTSLPPETPCAKVFQRTGWVQQYVGYAAEEGSYSGY